jgi:hypothetical protein
MVIAYTHNGCHREIISNRKEEYMATVTLQGNEIHTIGDLPEKGQKAPDFTLTRADSVRARTLTTLLRSHR